MNTEGYDTGVDKTADIELSLADRWIVSRLQEVATEVAKQFDAYRFDLAATALYEFTWNEYCDWYLELAKPILNTDSSDAAKRGTRKTLVNVLETILRMLHPITPFITEEAWQSVAPLAGKHNDTIMLEPYPEADASKIDLDAEAELEWVKKFVIGVRKIRSEMDIAPSKALAVVLLAGLNDNDQAWLKTNELYLLSLAKLASIEVLLDEDNAPESAVALVGEMKVLIPMAGLIDKDAEIARLNKEIGKLQGEIKRLGGKLSNQGFVAKAPESVVAIEREKLAHYETALKNLEAQYEKMQQL